MKVDAINSISHTREFTGIQDDAIDWSFNIVDSKSESMH